MIYSLTGKLLEKTPAMAVIDCGGVGYLVHIPHSAAGELPAVGQSATVYTHLNVSENDVALYGFSSPAQREVFLALTGVSGVGPKAGLAILSVLTPQQIVLAVSAGDHKAFTAASGVGPKLGQRLVLELRDKLAKGLGAGGVLLEDVAAVSQGTGPAGAARQAVDALTALGYTQSEAAAAVAPIDQSMPVGEIVRLALRSIAERN